MNVAPATPTRQRAILANVLVVAMCGLVYELLCATVASYLLGDAVLQFSLVLGAYLAALGVGAWASRALEARAGRRYVEVEIALAIVGGGSVPLLLAADASHLPVRPILYAVVLAVGCLVGVELPLLVHVLRREPARDASGRFGDVVARALAYDYAGALAASLLFPLVLVPRLGLVRTSIATGAINGVMAVMATYLLPDAPRALRAASAAILVVLVVLLARSDAWLIAAE